MDIQHLDPVHFQIPEFCNKNESITQNVTESADVGATIASPIIMFCIGAIGNIMALVVLYKTRNSGVFYTLVTGLVWTDLMGILLTSPITILVYINNREWVGGEMMCKFGGFVMICFGLATPLIVSAMAVERFLALRHALVHSQKCNNNCARIVIVTLWIIVLIFGLLPLFGIGRYSIQYPCTWCFLDFHSSDPMANSYGYLYAVVNLSVVVVMTTCNCYVIVTLLRVRYFKKMAGFNGHEEFQRSSKKHQKRRKRQQDRELQMVILMSIVTTVFAVCWAPLMVGYFNECRDNRVCCVLGTLNGRLF